MAGAAGVHAARLFFDHSPEFLSDLGIVTGQVAHHGDARHGGAKLIVLDGPGADLIHSRGAVAHGLQKRMLDADFGKRLDILLELIHEFLASHSKPSYS